MSALERAIRSTFESKINAEGRVVVPAAIRRLLGVGSGDRVLFVSDEQGAVYLTSPKVLVHAVWANNPGGESSGTGDSAEDVRLQRDADQQRELEQIGELMQSDVADHRTDDEVVDELFASLALPR